MTPAPVLKKINSGSTPIF